MHYKQNNKESKTFVQGLRPFVNTLPRGIRGILKKNGYNYSEIVNKWNMLVGEEISRFSYPRAIKMAKKHEKSILVIAVERGNEINIEYGKKQIMDKINAFFGYQLIKEIRLETFNPEIKKNNDKNSTLNKFPKKLEKKK